MPEEKTIQKNKQVLYRKWRSRDFNEIVDQKHVVRTLKNALAMGRIAAAYLFSGPRGTGKTSMARILAKSVNCPNAVDGMPCNDCRMCRSIAAGTHLDVIEMDAASHTQVDKIREFIVEKVHYRPTEAKRKIYIIDEVHKLSSFSFDALLKTIEEPPPFVTFVLATTEPDKLPPTILSRCQRFDFKRIPVNLIVSRLKEVSEAEGFEIEEGALNVIAQAADGALRDALVVLEQAVSFSSDVVTVGDVVSLLGITGADLLFEFGDLIIEKDTRRGLEFIDRVYRDGKDLKRLTVDMLEHFRRLLLVRLVREAETILEVTSEMYSRLYDQAQQYKVSHLLHVISDLMELRKNIKEVGLDRILWEMSVVRLTRWETIPSLESLARKVSAMEKRIASGGTIQPAKEFKPPARTFTPPPPKPKKSEAAGVAADTETVEMNVSGMPRVERKAAPSSAATVDDAKVWHQLLREVKKSRFEVFPILKVAEAGRISGDNYILKIDPRRPFDRNILERNRKYLEELLYKFTGKRLKLKFESMQTEHLFDTEEKPHQVFVDEVADLFGASPADKTA